MHKLLTRQIEKCRDPSGTFDLDKLIALVTEAYDTAERDRRRTDRSIGLMIEELDQMNLGLERLIAERTAALKGREAELHAQNLLFDAAINNMSQGLLMFDGSGRLVICNSRYREMYSLDADAVRPGRSLLELITDQVTNKTLVGEPEQLAENVLAAVDRASANGWLNGLPDGRTISVRLHTIAGGGWVTTHEDVTERREAERRIAHMSRHDALTDLPNRAALIERLNELIASVGPQGRLAILFLNIDHFKGINDTLGHALGDELLTAVSQRLRNAIAAKDALARIGGDEFAIVQTGLKRGASEAAVLAARLCEVIRVPFRLHEQDAVIDATIGISIYPDDCTEAADLLKNADIALDRAKATSRGAFRFFEPEMDARMKARRGLELALRNALPAGEFELHYQPVVDLADGRVTCCEALIRWHPKDRPPIGPDQFIPVVEEIGLIGALGEWVLRRACADARHWPDEIRLAVNLSPTQLTNPRLVPVVMNALASSGLPASRLEVEITESVLLQNTDTTLSALHRLHALGVRISMDDFGTGYSSLSALRSFPFDKIKIDRSFIKGLPDDQDSVAIVRTVANLARSLNMKTTAEGVETSAQMEEVRKLGCTEMQGYYFSRPRPIGHIDRLLNGNPAPAALTA